MDILLRKRKIAICLSTLFLSTLSVPVFANATATMAITAQVLASCTITSTPPAKVTYDPMSTTPTATNGVLNVACTNNYSTTIDMDNGKGTGCTGPDHLIIFEY